MWKQILNLLLNATVDNILLLQSSPYIPFMIESFHVTNSKSQVGYLVGLFSSTFYICQFISSFFFGKLSDKIGRKKVLLFGSLSLLITIFLFGFTFTIWWVFLFKGLSGLLYGNLGVSKTMLNEICNSGNQAFCMSTIGFSDGIAGIIAPLLGGYTVELDVKKGSFLDKYPYFLPNAISAALSLVAFIIVLIFLKETLLKRRPLFDCDLMSPDNFTNKPDSQILSKIIVDPKSFFYYANQYKQIDIILDEFENIDFEKDIKKQMKEMRSNSISSNNKKKEDEWKELYPIFPEDFKTEIVSETEIETETDPNLISSDRIEEEIVENQNEKKKITDENDYRYYDKNFNDNGQQTFKEFIKNHKYVILPCLLYGLFSFFCILFETVVPLFCFQSKSDSGLGFSPSNIAIGNSVASASYLFFQMIIYPRIAKYFSPANLFRLTIIISSIFITSFPYLSIIDQKYGTKTTWVFFLFIYTINYGLSTFAYTSVFLIISNSARSYRIGSINGIGQTFAALFRSFGPILSGSIYSWSLTNSLKYPFNYFFVFYINAIIGIITIAVSFFIPKWINKRSYLRIKKRNELKKKIKIENNENKND
ncbi:mfs general substrate transporter [Anaeramoeba ignava]|uniref:Mfs general substrate transporter n=1 Tax=Anaeramoeba ignava TaxID=1746090 RepID=A0A9Q0LDD0_ANAIG|nr:mfs general substrate transporter [Anaeramoeba ignava]